MTVLAIGLNHHSAPLDVRARFAFTPERLPAALHSLRARLARTAPEATLLSTCNRTELYVAANDRVAGDAAADLAQPALAWLAEQGGAAGARLTDHAYVAEGTAAARHAFRVAAGLDSMVLGEPQILGQIKLAVREAGLAGTLGCTLHQLFQRSFAVAKEVRSATEIGAHSVSMAAAAVRLSLQLFEDLAQVRVLLVGAGEMIELAAAHFADRKPLSMTLANRTAERGQGLARRFGAQLLPWAELPLRLHEFDVVVSCTASTLPIIGLGAVERALKSRRRRPMFMVDLAVPRDIEPEVARLADVYLYTVDDLSALVQTGGEKRQAAVARAEEIVDAGVRGFAHWLDQRANVPLIRALNAQAETWRAAELERAKRQLARGEPVEVVLGALARGLTAKLMHGAMTELRGADGEHREQMALAVQRLFLGQPQRPPAPH
ncbi:MAG: glutamyl-tRNA reductase [Rubrivivax sp.]|nr:glutamyl-tRNA reductase [Rubrivivax sp.]